MFTKDKPFRVLKLGPILNAGRPDRDKYVKVWRENIDDEEYEDDYQKIFFGNNFGIDYDVL